MSLFRLTRKIPVTIFRYPQGDYINGDWVVGPPTEVPIEANIQPMSYHETLQFLESERTKKWCNVWTESLVRTNREGLTGWNADLFYWQGDLYEVRKVQSWSMGVLNHYHAQACRLEITPDGIPTPEEIG